jgi:hypothetical protein
VRSRIGGNASRPSRNDSSRISLGQVGGNASRPRDDFRSIEEENSTKEEAKSIGSTRGKNKELRGIFDAQTWRENLGKSNLLTNN